MKIIKNILLQGKHSKPILVDVFFKEDYVQKPIVIFIHGYKGYKDWGAWNLMAKAFAKAGFFFVKFNFSHNGGTPKQPIDFPDLEAFGNNNFTKELDDLTCVIDWVLNEKSIEKEINKQQLALIGHSRGGGIVLIKSEEDRRVTKVITLAGVSDFKNRFPKGTILEQWKKNNVVFIENGRTKQQMPHFYQFYKDFIAHEKRFNIKRAVKNLKIPHLLIHGDADSTVSIKEGITMQTWSDKNELIVLKNADHVFGTHHPWKEKRLSEDLEKVVAFSIVFFNS